MFITKKEVAEKTVSTRGTGFSPSVVQKDEMEWGFVFLLSNYEEVLIARVENEDGEQWSYEGSNETFDTPEDALDDYITSFTG